MTLRFLRRIPQSSLADHLPEPHPLLSIELLQLDLFDDVVIGTAGVHADAWQQQRQLEVLEIGRLVHDVLAGEVVAALSEDLH